MANFVCLICSTSFWSRRSGAKYCSKTCYSESLKQYRLCAQCGKPFANHANAAFCSQICAVENKIGKKLSATHRQAVSEGRKNSSNCKGPRLYNWKGGYANTRRRQKARYHRKRAAGPIDFVYLKILLILQRNRCFYCGNEFKNSKDRSIEHLQPIAKGGTNEWFNLVYACSRCNSKKKDTPFPEFAIKNLRLDWLNNMVQAEAYQIRKKYETSSIQN